MALNHPESKSNLLPFPNGLTNTKTELLLAEMLIYSLFVHYYYH